MRRRHDDWINATHILKAAGFDKPARTRILEREVQKDVHEKIQGGYGKYQGIFTGMFLCSFGGHANVLLTRYMDPSRARRGPRPPKQCL
jgi:hypothetical protein